MSEPIDSETRPSSKGGAERRRWPRAQAEWPVTIALEDGYHEARLRDVSRSGLCFFLDRPIKEMTLLQVQLKLPHPTGQRDLRCNGVVVRSMKVSPHLDHYEVAVFLNEITEDNRTLLESFVDGIPVG